MAPKSTIDPVADWLSKARIAARYRAKYMASGLASLVPVAAPGLGTFAVTPQWHMLYDPELHKVWSVDETATVLLHELGHLLREHSQRCIENGFDAEMWNRAGDAEINDDLQPPFPSKDVSGKAFEPVFPKDFDAPEHLTAEHYYLKGRERQAKSGSAKPDCRCGSGAGGKPLPQEALADPAKGRSAAEGKRIAAKVAEAIQAQEKAAPGTVPGGWKVWAGEALKPARIPWQQKLAKLCRNAVAYRAGFGAQTYTKLNRRQSALGNVGRLPAPLQPIPRVMVGFDTSGSMGGELERGMSEVQGILRAVGADVEFIALDTEIHGRAKVKSIKEAVELLGGGGGTDFRPLFEAASGRSKPDVLVFVTDGYGPAPAAPPRGVNVIWLLTPGGKCPVSWGSQLQMEA